ncbi:MAG: hypothetical protein IJL87_03685, partial [Clostridia bacterium]|nr:hypothetical protein [Clostridia bacterium]
MKNITKKYLLIAVLALSLVLSGCTSGTVDKNENSSSAPIESETQTESNTESTTESEWEIIETITEDGIKLSKSSAILLNNTMHYTLSILALSGCAMIWKGSFIFSPERSKSFIVLFIVGTIANVLGFATCLLFMFAPGLVRALLTPVYRLLARIHIIKNLDA